MPLSWNEIRSNAYVFANAWKDETREVSEAQTFWNEFLAVFGVSRRAVASFEEPVRNLKNQFGFIDLFWKGVLLAEHKSRGKSLAKAHSQALDYVQDLQREGREKEIPGYVIVSDFARIALHDLESDETIEFPLADLPKRIRDFAFVAGYKTSTAREQDPINLEAVEIMGRLHDALEDGGYAGHDLERMLVRVLFCLFAEDSGIFEREEFRLYVEQRTAEDGSDLGAHLARFFGVLNTPKEKRQANLDELLQGLPYVNGDLFSEQLGFAEFNRSMRNALLACTRFDWSEISPAIFGSLFQSVMDDRERRKIGAHYTSERDILKIVGPLFLDDLKAEFETAKRSERALGEFHAKLGRLRIMDPACGCGNFLVVAYRELRLLELEVLKVRYKPDAEGLRQRVSSIDDVSVVDVDAFYGIEIDEWPARIAEVAMWLMDHQMNVQVSNAFGQYLARLPLRKSPTIVHGNALRVAWEDVLPPGECSYVLGNPPFVGAKWQSAEQRADMEAVAGDVKNYGLLDYVCGWYFKAARYIRGTSIRVGFVSTNSISQGEQVGTLWNELFRRYGVAIQFAHRTFAWASEARGKAHVHVVIVGFGNERRTPCALFDYPQLNAEPVRSDVPRIGPYLVEGPDFAITNRSRPISRVPPMLSGNKPIDDGNYLFTPAEREEFVNREPESADLFCRWLGGQEFIQGIERWCLYLRDVSPERLRRMPLVLERIEAVRKVRESSASKPTRELAATPTRFHTEFFSTDNYIALPEVSSERRKYIPVAFLGPDVLCGNKLRLIPEATLLLFGVMTSEMHMAWVRQVSGRLESRFQYSVKLVYNNFPFPLDVADAKREAVERDAQAVLDARAKYPDATLADLYDPRTMPADLLKAHQALDRSVDRCYRSAPFTNDRQRMEFLFDLYAKYDSSLLAEPKKTPRKRSGAKSKGDAG